jgi:hypothetical protein
VRYARFAIGIVYQRRNEYANRKRKILDRQEDNPKREGKRKTVEMA